MPSIVHALEATRARLTDEGHDGVDVRFTVTAGEGAVAHTVRHTQVRRAHAAPTDARATDMDEAVWWLTHVHTTLLKACVECSSGSGPVYDTAGDAHTDDGVKRLVQSQCATLAQYTEALRDHLLYTKKHLTEDALMVTAQRAVEGVIDEHAAPPETTNIASLSVDVTDDVKWTGNPVHPSLRDEHGGLKLNADTWKGFIPVCMHAAVRFAHAASVRDMPTPTLTRAQKAAFTGKAAAAVDMDTLRAVQHVFTGFDMMMTQLCAPWTMTEVPLRTTTDVFAFGKCISQYMTRMLRHPNTARNGTASALRAVKVWAARDHQRTTLIPEGAPLPRVVHWHVIPCDAPWTLDDAKAYARCLNTAAARDGRPPGAAPVHAAFCPTAADTHGVVAKALEQYAPNVVQNVPALVTDVVDDEDEQQTPESNGSGGSSADVNEPSPLEVALCSVAAIVHV